MEEQQLAQAALWATIDKQYAVLEKISGIALNLPRLLIEALEQDGAFRLGNSRDFVESALHSIAQAHQGPEHAMLTNVITTLLRELKPRIH